MELAELCKISEKYAMDDNKTVGPSGDSSAVRPKVVLERKSGSYSRSIRCKKSKRIQRSRSKSLPALPTLPPTPFTELDFRGNISDNNLEDIQENVENIDSVLVRHFSTTMKGLVNKGDLRKDNRRDSVASALPLRRESAVSLAGSNVVHAAQRRESAVNDYMSRRHSSIASTYCTPVRRTSCMTPREYNKLNVKYPNIKASSQESVLDENPQEYHVLVLGNCGVGKSAIINQFTTSEFLGTSDVLTDYVGEKTSISVILNKEESVLHLHENNDMVTFHETADINIDAYVVVYSCADHASFKSAQYALQRLKEEVKGLKTVMLVANKVDLARKRQVDYEGGRLLANSYNCKYIETSAALNHNLDELLAGLLSQIRLKQYGLFLSNDVNKQKKHRNQKGLTRALKTAFKGVFGKKQKMSSCENLYEI